MKNSELRMKNYGVPSARFKNIRGADTTILHSSFFILHFLRTKKEENKMENENLYTFENPEYRKTFWHTSSHVMAQAVKRLWPEVQLAIGPAIDEGWYYDFDAPFSFTPEHLEKIEGEMKKICKERIRLERSEKPRQEAIAYFTDFIGCGEKGTGKPVPQLICWQQDAPIIIGEVNRVAGQEIREKPFVHWWTFLAWFHAVGEGQLSFLVSLRDKLRRGQKLEAWEETYYRENREKVDISPRYTQREKDQRAKLLALLDGKKEQVN